MVQVWQKFSTGGLYFILALLWSVSAQAKRTESAPHVGPKVLDFGVGTRLTNFTYAEEISAPGKSTEAANFASLLLDTKLYAADQLSHLNLRFEFANAVISRYSGSDLITGAPATANNPLAFANYEATANIALSEHLFFYLGYGYRKWNRFLSGAPGYREIYSWYYTPVGARVWFVKGVSVDYGFDFSLRPTSRGVINVITSQTYTNGQDSQMNLGNKMGYKVAFPVHWHSSGWAFDTSAWYEHSEIGQSNITSNTTLSPSAGTGIVEPNSKTDQVGLELLFSFSL